MEHWWLAHDLPRLQALALHLAAEADDMPVVPPLADTLLHFAELGENCLVTIAGDGGAALSFVELQQQQQRTDDSSKKSVMNKLAESSSLYHTVLRSGDLAVSTGYHGKKLKRYKVSFTGMNASCKLEQVWECGGFDCPLGVTEMRCAGSENKHDEPPILLVDRFKKIVCKVDAKTGTELARYDVGAEPISICNDACSDLVVVRTHKEHSYSGPGTLQFRSSSNFDLVTEFETKEWGAVTISPTLRAAVAVSPTQILAVSLDLLQPMFHIQINNDSGLRSIHDMVSTRTGRVFCSSHGGIKEILMPAVEKEHNKPKNSDPLPKFGDLSLSYPAMTDDCYGLAFAPGSWKRLVRGGKLQ